MAESAYKILIVDDVEVNRKLISAGLEGRNYELSYAENGRRALDMMLAEPFDLILLDIMMPEMTGYEVLERMMENPTLREIPVVVISAVDDVKSISKCVRMGADDYLMKPIDLTLLRARVAASMEKKRNRDRIAEYLTEIDSERRRYDRLLGMVFPPQVVDELKETNEVRARKHNNVAILFADVVGFTSYCAEREPDDIVSHLQEMVVACEAIAAKFGLLKIKTIGDCFMATAGLLKPTGNPVADSIRSGLEMISLVRMLDAGWTLRVGVHIGSVMTGIVGYRQHLYDVFGDAVNIAAHVQSSGVPGAVNVSADAWEKVSSEFEADSRNTVSLKHRGDMEVFTVFPSSNNTPNVPEAANREPEQVGEENGSRTSL